MNERIIWRPNAIALEDWNGLSREEQIQWWKNQQPKRASDRPNPMKMIVLYDRGVLTRTEMLNQIVHSLTEENIARFLEYCPADVWDELHEVVAGLPEDDDDQSWGKLISIASVSFAPWVTLDEIRRVEEESNRQFRAGVALFRREARI
jgi:hypothetical protein